MNEPKKTAIAKPYDIVKDVEKTLQGYTEHGELVIPENYSIENSLKSAWLVLQETVNKDKQPVLQSCSQPSIANALLDMAVQGLNPGKKQCYFIAYGRKLLCQRSYFGAMVVAERVANATDIWAEVVYTGDVFEYEIGHNRKVVTKHTQKLSNVGGKIQAAYCVVEFGDDKPGYTEIMTMEQIQKAWDKSKANTALASSTHSTFPDEMCKRTVINRACKKLINSSSDSNLFIKHFNRADEEQTEGEVTEEIAENANKNLLEIGETDEPEERKTETASKSFPTPKRDPKTIKTIEQMFKACKDDFSLTETEVCKELGVTSETDLTDTPTSCYLQVAVIRDAQPEQEGSPGF